MIILSHFQAKNILGMYVKKAESCEVSLDLGISLSKVSFSDGKVIFPDKQEIQIDDIKKIAETNKVCFAVEENTIKKIHLFSEDTNRFYKLLPTGFNTAPTVEISGIRMHAVKGISPLADAKQKVDSIKPFSGMVLDTCTGLGYTAILSSESGEVYTHEKDKNMVIMEKYNPWSERLFSSKNIHAERKSIIEKIPDYKDGFFDRIMHDPPSFKIASELYMLDFYKELFRVLKKEGKLYHYIGNPDGKKGVNIERGVLKRLEKCGFRFAKRAAKGVVVVK